MAEPISTTIATAVKAVGEKLAEISPSKNELGQIFEFKEIPETDRCKASDLKEMTEFQDLKSEKNETILDNNDAEIITKEAAQKAEAKKTLGNFANDFKGNCGELCRKQEDLKRGAMEYSDQINYKDEFTGNTKIADYGTERPRGSSIREVQFTKEGTKEVEKIFFKDTKTIGEVKNWEPENFSNKKMVSHLYKQMDAMKDAFPDSRRELSLPSDTALDPSIQGKLMELQQKLHFDIVTHAPIGWQRKMLGVI